VDASTALFLVAGGLGLLWWIGTRSAGGGGQPATAPPPTGADGQPIYGPPYSPELVLPVAPGLTISYATRDLYYRPIPVSLLPSYNLDPQQVTTPITDAVGALVGWLIPLRQTSSGWGTIDPGRGNVAV
jgi:hypothetical protein